MDNKQFLILCEYVIESIIDRTEANKEVDQLTAGYTVSNMVYTIKTINNTFNRCGLYNDSNYTKAYTRLKEILKNIEAINNNSSNAKIINNNRIGIEAPTYNKEIKIYKFGDNKEWYVQLEGNKGIIADMEYIKAKDKYNNSYLLKYTEKGYKFIKGYSNKIGNRLLLKNFSYINAFGSCKYKTI